MTRPGWAPEIIVSPELASRLIGTQFPELDGAAAVCIASGWDNTVYLAAGTWIFRFPRRQAALPCTITELAVLPVIAGRLPLPVPLPCYIGEPGPDFPWPFWGARLLPGTELADSGLAGSRRGPAAAATGTFLQALHACDLPDALQHALPADPNRRGDVADRAQRSREVLDRLARAGIWHPDRAVLGLLGQASPADEPPPGRAGEHGTRPSSGPTGDRATVLCHGDLHIRHLLVDEAGNAAGVIDWGDACIGDPAIDLSIAYSAFEGPQRAGLLTAYGQPPGPGAELRARVLAVFLSAALAEYAAAQERPALLADSLAGIRRAISD